jgi:hypothetical protein
MVEEEGFKEKVSPGGFADFASLFLFRKKASFVNTANTYQKQTG